MALMMNKFLSEVYEKHVPLRKIRVHRHHIRKLSDETKALMRLRNRARKHNNPEYKNLRYQVNRAIRKRKKRNN